jgi:uncharacterized membrane protein
MKYLLTFFAVFIFFFAVPTTTLAVEKINSFNVKIMAHEDGSMTVTEEIIYDFDEEDRHGIFRFIPTVSKVGELYRQIKVDFQEILRDGKGEKFEEESGSREVSVKIGDPDKTVTGSPTYTIKYLVANGIGSNFDDHDEIYWNVTGNDWEVEISSASVELGTDFGKVPTKAVCLTGYVGAQDTACSVPINPPFSPIQTTQALLEGQGLTVVYGFEKGVFPPSTLSTTEPGSFEEFISNPVVAFLLIAGVIFFNLILAPALLFWYFKNKRKERLGPPAVNFDFPSLGKNQLLPAEAGAVDTSKIEKDDVLATIYDLAIKKYILIEQTKKDKILLGIDVGDKEEFKIKKLKDYQDLSKFEKTLLDRLFRGGDETEIGSLKTDFYKTFADLEKDLFRSLVDKKLYTKNPKNQKAGLIIGGVFTLVTLQLLLALVLFFLASRLNGRTKQGDLVDHQVDGLKLFLKGRSREYNWNADNLQVVEKMIPYAMSLGYIDRFMEQFKIHYPDYSPSWYSGYQPFYISNSSLFSSMNSNLTTSAPSSSSGFSGGGSSGGGGGGGGGGSW